MATKPKTLYLIDGANYIFRAFYAIRHLSNSKGLPTNALYGFTNMLRKLMREHEPDYVVICFDTAEPTFRDELYEEYKANRKEPPDELVQQFPYVIPIVEALGIPLVEKPGFEADDLIGTLARRFASPLLQVVIVSGDKDLMQLIGDHVTILDEMKELHIGRKGVEERFGVGPEKVVDVLALSGDQSDNVPGVKGIGPKTASKLVAKYGDLENVIAHAGEVTGATGQRIKEDAEIARLSKRLVTIDSSVPLEMTLEKMRPVGVDRNKITILFKELEFTKLLDELAPETREQVGTYELIDQENALRKLVQLLKNKEKISIYIETDSPQPVHAQIRGISVAWAGDEASFIPFSQKEEAPGSGDLFSKTPDSGSISGHSFQEIFGPVLADPGIRKVGHDLNQGLTILRSNGFEVNGGFFDSMLASYVLDPAGNHTIEHLARTLMDMKLPERESSKGKGRSKKPAAVQGQEFELKYACSRAAAAFGLQQVLEQKVKDSGLFKLFSEIEMPLMEVLAAMQMSGVNVDTARLLKLGETFSAEMGELEARIHKMAGEEFNINSPKQLATVLFEKLGLQSGAKTKTGYSTSQDVLEDLALEHEMPALVLRWRSIGKLKSTYIDALPILVNPKTGRIHTTFNQTGTATGRLSSSDPNMQNIPIRTSEGRSIREAFIADEGMSLVSADYSQIELRLLAHMSKEPELLSAFNEGTDVHSLTASGIFGIAPAKVTKEQRAIGKTVNFATIYGQTAYGLSKQLGISASEAGEYIENYFRKYRRVAQYREESLEAARRQGYIETIFGRRRSFLDLKNANAQMRALAERMAFNMIFQGSAADIIKKAMITVHAGLGDVSKYAMLLLQVHDELVLEAPDKELAAVMKFVKEAMENPVSLDVPLVVDVGSGKNWADAH